MTEMTPSEGLAAVQLHLVDSVSKAEEFLRWLGERRPHGAIGLDIETGEGQSGDRAKGALNPWKGEIRLVQIGDAEQGWAFPWAEWAGVVYQGLSSYEGPIVCHNIGFEALWFALQSRWDVPWHRMHDTMIMSQVIAPDERAGLKPLASRYVDHKAVALQSTLDNAMHDNGWTWGTVPITFEPYWAYGALDTVLTIRLWLQFYEKCGPGGEYETPYQIEMNTRRICTTMELNGARVDLEYSQKKLNELTQYTTSVKDWMKGTYGGTSITSNVQLVRLFEKLGAEITEYTPSGQKSMTKDQLKLLTINGTSEVKMVAETVLKQRKADKLASSYFSNFLSDNIDGLVHPSIRTMGARTGRMSITNPALQTLPSGDPTVRDAFIPRNDGEGIISSDLDQVEFRLTAGYSGDDALIELFLEADRTGGDVFTEIMRDVYNDRTLDKERDSAKRKLIKSVVYGKLYGAGPSKMALTAGVPEEQMLAVVNAFDRSYPGVKSLQKSIEAQGTQRLKETGVAFVKTKTGRRLPGDDNRVYSLTNYLIQATAAEVFKTNLIKLDQADLTEFMVVPVHDEIVLSAPLDLAEDMKHVIKDCMTTTDGWPVPLTSGVDGPFNRWGDPYHKKD